MKSLLLVEDNLYKKERASAFLADSFAEISISFAASFTSACRLILERHFDVIVMDMSLPTYDKTPKESGGRFRTFGGREVARKVIRRNIPTKIIFLTQYPAFKDDLESHTLESLRQELKRECGSNYCGVVQYDSSTSKWKDELKRLVLSVL